MYATDYVQIYTLLLGLYLNNKALDSLFLLGIPYLPFAVCIIRNLAQVKKAGEDQGDAAGLYIRYLFVDVVIMFLVFIIFIYPMGSNISINPQNVIKSTCSSSGAMIDSDIEWNNTINKLTLETSNIQKNVEDKIFNNSQKVSPNYDHNIYFQGISAQAPVGINIVHNATVIVSSMIASSIPCVTDLRTIALKDSVATLPDTNTALQTSFTEFVAQCYQPNLRDVINSSTLNTYNFEEKLWPGAPIFTDPTGLYAANKHTYSIDKMQWNRVKQIQYGNPTPTINERENPTKSSDYILSCDNAYTAISSSLLRERDAQQNVDTGVLNGINDLYKYVTGWTQEKQDDRDLRSIYNQSHIVPVNQAASDYFDKMGAGEGGNFLVRAGAETGLAMSRTTAAMDSQIKRLVLPIFFATAGMVIIMLSPILIILSGYDIKVTVGLMCGLIVTSSSTLLLSVASWIDNTLLPLIASKGIKEMSLGNWDSVTSASAMGYVGSITYEFLPLLWVVLFSSIGAIVTQGVGAFAGSIGKGTGSNATSLLSKAGGKGVNSKK